MSYPFFTPFKALILGWLLSVITISGYMELTDSRPSVAVFATAFVLLCVLYWSFTLTAYKLFCEDSKVLTVDFWRQVRSECTENKDFYLFSESSNTFTNIWCNKPTNLERRRIVKLANLFLKDSDYDLYKFWRARNASFLLFMPVSIEPAEPATEEYTYSNNVVGKLFIDWCINYFTYHKYNP